MTLTIRPATLSGSFAFAGDELETLAARLEGQIITAADADYDAARKVVMITVDRRPLAIVRAAKVTFDSNKGKEAARLYQDLLKRFGEKLPLEERADAMLKLGESWMKAGDYDEAILPLTEAADMLPDSPVPINALCKVYEANKDWEEVVRLKPSSAKGRYIQKGAVSTTFGPGIPLDVNAI